MNKNVPNILTISRFIFIPFIVTALILDKYILAFILLSLSALTDVLDGFIARKFNFITDFGKLIDPLADKTTQLAILITLSIKQTPSGEPIVPIWILLIIFIKELLMVSGASFLYGKDLVVSSKWYGKLATVLFYAAMVISLLLEQIGESTSSLIKAIGVADNILYYFAVITTIASLIMYMKAFYIQGYLKKEIINKK